MIVFGSVVEELHSLGYTLAKPVIPPSKPINRPLKTDWYNGTTYNRLAKNSPHYPEQSCHHRSNDQ